jgi:hypothetical protein
MNAFLWAHHCRKVVAMAFAAAVLAGCSSSEEGDFPGNDRPGFLVAEQRFVYDGTTDDLLTADLGKSGVNATLRNANLRGKPAIIVHGRSDTLVPPAFTSHPYFG